MGQSYRHGILTTRSILPLQRLDITGYETEASYIHCTYRLPGRISARLYTLQMNSYLMYKIWDFHYCLISNTWSSETILKPYLKIRKNRFCLQITTWRKWVDRVYQKLIICRVSSYMHSVIWSSDTVQSEDNSQNYITCYFRFEKTVIVDGFWRNNILLCNFIWTKLTILYLVL